MEINTEITNIFNGTVTITGNSVSTVTSELIDGGTENEKTVFTITGSVPSNQPTVVGTLRVSSSGLVDDDLYPEETGEKRGVFKKSPFLKNEDGFLENIPVNESVKLKFKSVEKDIINADSDGRTSIGQLDGYTSRGAISGVKEKSVIKAYIYDIIYTSNEIVTKANNLKFELSPNLTTDRNLTTRQKTGITKFDFGGKWSTGVEVENRKITISGYPETTVDIMVNKITEVKDAVAASVIIQKFDESILPEKITYSDPSRISIKTIKGNNSRVVNGRVESDIKYISVTLDSTGRFTYTQQLPKGGSGQRYVVRIKDGNNGALSGSTSVHQRNAEYGNKGTKTSWHKEVDEHWDRTDPFWDDWHSRFLDTKKAPVMTLTLMDSNARTNITALHTQSGNSQLLGSGGGGGPLSINKVGILDQENTFAPPMEFEVTYKLTSAQTFNVVGASPLIFSHGAYPSATSWDPSLPSSVGGTEFYITGISRTIETSGHVAWIKFKVLVEVWGTEDFTTSLNINSYINAV